MKPDTGETTASINRRADKQVWPRVMAALARDAVLVRMPRLKRYAIQEFGSAVMVGPTVSAATVARAVRAGVLRVAGQDRFALDPSQNRRSSCPTA